MSFNLSLWQVGTWTWQAHSAGVPCQDKKRQNNISSPERSAVFEISLRAAGSKWTIGAQSRNILLWLMTSDTRRLCDGWRSRPCKTHTNRGLSLGLIAVGSRLPTPDSKSWRVTKLSLTNQTWAPSKLPSARGETLKGLISKFVSQHDCISTLNSFLQINRFNLSLFCSGNPLKLFLFP